MGEIVASSDLGPKVVARVLPLLICSSSERSVWPQEYRVALAAAVEDKLEKVCDQTNLTDSVCVEASISIT